MAANLRLCPRSWSPKAKATVTFGKINVVRAGPRLDGEEAFNLRLAWVMTHILKRTSCQTGVACDFEFTANEDGVVWPNVGPA